MIRIEVCGLPRPGGSKIPGLRKDGTLFVRPASKHTSTWMGQVEDAAVEQMTGELLCGAIEMFYEFRFPRPKKHFRGKSETLRADAPIWHTNKPDLTKIIRSTEDALTGIVWKDDSKVCKRAESKRYCNGNEKPGVTMTIFEIHDGINFD
ncbi:MAG: RusA family crossover junction endodeoxyribonuclease [Cyanobacteria bacterium SZAS TMP-1]|nr:RusA family crossover junction endodeoxyribonuclease [Cyanobacteria bacterium SZAS TMP-1]